MKKLPAQDLDHVLAATAELWPQLDGARLFITGGTGFFGVWLLETLLAARERFNLDTSAVVLTRDPAGFEAKASHLASEVTLLEGDVRSFGFRAGTFDYVIHAATEASARLNEEQPLEMFDSIVTGTRRVLDFAAQAKTRRLLFVSSGAVYGRQPLDMSHVDEDFSGGPNPTDVRSAYGEGKRAAELLCAMSPVETAIARCFAFVGPHLPLDRHFAIGNFIGDALEGRTINVRGDGTPLRSYLYAADLAICLWTILFRGAPMRPYNVGSEHAVSVADLAHAIAKTNPLLRVDIAGTPDPAKEPERYVPSTRRAQQELGLAEQIGLDDAVARTIAWHSESR
jgi:nucleoside-diphosphate-sugar epimerase